MAYVPQFMSLGVKDNTQELVVSCHLVGLGIELKLLRPTCDLLYSALSVPLTSPSLYSR